MEFHLAVSTYVGGLSTLVNGLFVILIFVSPPDNLGIFRSQYYAGAIASFMYAATQMWSAPIFHADGTLFVVFSARSVGPVVYLAALAAINWQFMMLSANLAARYAAIRGGWIHYYLSNQALFYGVQLTCVLGAYIPPIILMSPTALLSFLTEYYFGCTYEVHTFDNSKHTTFLLQHIVWDNIFVHLSIFLMAAGFQGGNLLLVLVFGLITFLHISKNTQSSKLKEAMFSFLFLFMPGMLINSSMIVRIDISDFSIWLSSFMSLGTLFNPFVDITLTPGYRKRIIFSIGRHRVRCWLKHQSFSS
ncbi:hypothetical protein PENTCL1PPCAC_20274 [Pristionchus entomophagus]|uniref:G protein-coupled receptor n=1 Tax=Pristionchus entomophagus TaxID=358040 RepID=A0AAV5TUJ4_9BILA|nr:hypothetical protein PENTCL1PPCAC_20274 [Pristionchus entomophagus]